MTRKDIKISILEDGIYINGIKAERRKINGAWYYIVEQNGYEITVNDFGAMFLLNNIKKLHKEQNNENND